MTENIKNALHQPEVDCALRNLFAGLKPASGSSDAAFLQRVETSMHAVDAIRSEMKRRTRIGHIALAAASAVSFTAGIAATLLMPDIIRFIAGLLPASLAVNSLTGDTAVTLSWAIAAALSISAAFGTYSLTRARLLCE